MAFCKIIGMLIALSAVTALESSQVVSINTNTQNYVPRINEVVPTINQQTYIRKSDEYNPQLNHPTNQRYRLNQIVRQVYVPQQLPTYSASSSQYQYQGADLSDQVAPRRRFYRQVSSFYPGASYYPKYEINEKSQYQAQGNAQNHIEGDYYSNYDRINSQYQNQEQGAYYRQRNRMY